MDEEKEDFEEDFQMHDDLDDDLLDAPEDMDFGLDEEDPDRDR